MAKYGAAPLRFIEIVSAELGTESDFRTEEVRSIQSKNDFLHKLIISLPEMKSAELSHNDFWLYSKLNSKVEEGYGTAGRDDAQGGLHRDVRKPRANIQTTLPSTWHSGDLLANADGQVVGITLHHLQQRFVCRCGIRDSFAIVRATAEQLIKNGKVEHGYIGIGMNDVTPDNAHFFNLQDANGAIVSQVTPDSPASRGGLKTGDVISQLNGQKITNGSALQVAVSEMVPGTKITIGVIRDGKSETLDLIVGQFHGNGEVASNDSQDGPQSGKLGLAVSNLTPETRQQFNVPDRVHGVVVENVRPASPADDAGIQPGDIILEVDRKSADSASQFADEVHQNKDGKDLLMLVWSKGNSSYRTIHPDQNNQNG